MTKYLPFVYIEEQFYTNQECFFINTNTPAYLMAFFNYSLFKYCFRDNFPELQGGTRELSKIFFDKISIKIVDEYIEKLFRDLLNNIQVNQSIVLIKHLDTLIFDLYQLTHDEAETIGYIEIQ